MNKKTSRAIDQSNLAVGIIGIVLTLATTAGVSYKYFVSYIWEILAGIELLIIFFLLFVKRRRNFRNFPSVKGVSDQKLFEHLLDLQIGRVSKVTEQAEDGYFTVHGIAVRDTQIEIIRYANKTTTKEVLGVEVVTDVSILFTRNEFWKANEEHISQGGTIKRIFLFSRDTILDSQNLKNFAHLLEYNKDIQVQVGIRIRDGLPSVLIQDYSLCRGGAVIVEGRQGEKEYKLANSTVYFKSNRLEEYESGFNSLWMLKTQSTASACAKRFFELFNDTQDWNSKETHEKACLFLEELDYNQLMSSNLIKK